MNSIFNWIFIILVSAVDSLLIVGFGMTFLTEKKDKPIGILLLGSFIVTAVVLVVYIFVFGDKIGILGS